MSQQAAPSRGVQRLLGRIAELEFQLALADDRDAAKDVRIAELEKNQKTPKRTP